MSQKPVVRVDSPWGTEIDTEGLQAGRDAFYVEGYSDKREQFDADVRTHGKPQALPFRFQYVSVQRQSGAPNKEKEAYYRSRGYVPVMYDEAATYGIDAAKSGFIREADGTCRVGSQMLMACPAKKVAGHAKDLADRNEALAQAYKSRAQAAADEFNRAHPDMAETAFEFDERNDNKPFSFEKDLKTKF